MSLMRWMQIAYDSCIETRLHLREEKMVEMLTAKDVQELLNVDRSTVYRMAEQGRLPAIKVGKQWRFPGDQIEAWFAGQVTAVAPISQSLTPKPESEPNNDLPALLPIECVQLIQDSYADILGVMLVITDMDGNPLTEVSNPCGLFTAISQVPDAVQKCIQSWHFLGTTLNFEPTFQVSHLGLLCARGLVRVGTELKGMVIAGCITPQEWPPSNGQVAQIAADFGVDPQIIQPHLDAAYKLNAAQRTTVLTTVQRIADIVAHIVNERQVLMNRLAAISTLAQL